MSGRKQHHIPQSLLKGFKVDSDGKTDQVWVFTKDKPPYVTSTKNVAAQRHFYSKLSADGSATLDDQITSYESGFADRLFILRSIPYGGEADSAIAAEVVTHLIVRNAHIRDIYSSGIKLLVDRTLGLLTDETNFRRLLGVDSETPTALFKDQINEFLKERPKLAQCGLPEPVLQQVAFVFVKENFDKIFAEQMPSISAVLGTFGGKVLGIARGGHNKALASDLVPKKRMEELCAFDWSVVDTPEREVILPDCVAIGINSNGEHQPLIVADAEKISIVFMPITADRLLVGQRTKASIPDLANFNVIAASCSHTFFVSSSNSPELASVIERIGGRSWTTIEDAVFDALSESGLSSQGMENDISSASDQTEPVIPSTRSDADSAELSGGGEVLETEGLSYSTQFIDCADEATAHRISQEVHVIVSAFAQHFSLGRLDGITFASDYAVALRDLDRGFPSSAPLTPTDKDYAVGVGMAPTVLRDGVLKGRLIIRGGLGHAMIGDDEANRSLAVRAVVYLLAQVAWIELFDRALPGVLLHPVEDSYESYLYSYADCIGSGYFSARISAGFDPEIGEGNRANLVTVLERTRKKILPARLTYRYDGDLDKMLHIALTAVRTILGDAAELLGHYDGLSQSSLDEVGELNAALDRLGLRAWFETYHRDLRAIWDCCGEWTSISQFFAFNRHIERVLWQFGVFLWRTPDGEIRAEVPLATDTRQLLSAILDCESPTSVLASRIKDMAPEQIAEAKRQASEWLDRLEPIQFTPVHILQRRNSFGIPWC